MLGLCRDCAGGPRFTHRFAGTVPRTVTAMAHDALRFIDALELREIDVLGISLGGDVAQELVLIRPRLVHRLILAGTGPQGGEDMHGFSD